MGIHDQLSNQCLAYKADYTLLVYACLHNWIPIQKKKKKKAGTGVWRISLPGCMGLYFLNFVISLIAFYHLFVSSVFATLCCFMAVF